MDVPTTPAARLYLKSQKTRGTHRTKKEGLQPEHIKPSKASKHKRNTGGKGDIAVKALGSPFATVVWPAIQPSVPDPPWRAVLSVFSLLWQARPGGPSLEGRLLAGWLRGWVRGWLAGCDWPAAWSLGDCWMASWLGGCPPT